MCYWLGTSVMAVCGSIAGRDRQAGAAGDEPADFSFRRRLLGNVRWLDTQPEHAAALPPDGGNPSYEVALPAILSCAAQACRERPALLPLPQQRLGVAEVTVRSVTWCHGMAPAWALFGVFAASGSSCRHGWRGGISTAQALASVDAVPVRRPTRSRQRRWR